MGGIRALTNLRRQNENRLDGRSGRSIGARGALNATLISRLDERPRRYS